MGKKLKMKYSRAFTKQNAKHYVIYRVLDKRRIANAYEIAAQILFFYSFGSGCLGAF